MSSLGYSKVNVLPALSSSNDLSKPWNTRRIFSNVSPTSSLPLASALADKRRTSEPETSPETLIPTKSLRFSCGRAERSIKKIATSLPEAKSGSWRTNLSKVEVTPPRVTLSAPSPRVPEAIAAPGRAIPTEPVAEE